MTLSACSGKSSDDYIGYWQENNDKKLVVMEIKQDNGNYFAIGNILHQRSVDKPILLTKQDDGKLLMSGMAQLPLALSDDKKTLYIHNDSFKKIDTATKDKLLAHQQACDNLAEQYKQERDAIKGENYEETKAKRQELVQQYKAKQEQLRQTAPCSRLNAILPSLP